jgi:dynamin family protein
VLLIDEASHLLDRAIELVPDGSPTREALVAARADIDGPLKVAVAGRVKAGKSTLVNALIGDQIAPTDAGECTQIVTWYRDGLTYKVEAVSGGERRSLPFSREGGMLEIDLGELTPDDIDRLEVDWPTAALRSHTIIDTPGIGSINAETSDRTVAFLTPEDETVTDADAVLYLMRHVHQTDVDFLEAFHDDEVAHAAPVNAVAVLSRADEIGVGRHDAMESAARIAAGYQADPKIRRLCASVVPVAGLLAQAGAALREAEYQAFRTLAELPDDVGEPMLWSADRFVDPDATDVLTGEERAMLIDQFGLFGVRLAVREIRDGNVATATELSRRLVDRSGIPELRATLDRLFSARRDVLKARSALAVIDIALAAEPALESLNAEAERIRAGAHELTEARYLNLIRGGTIPLKEPRREEIERLLGAEGVDASSRLGLPSGSSEADLRAAAVEALARQQRAAESSMSGQEARDVARVAVRSCEGLLAELTIPRE